jgi:glycosyltransferase involved in cell wall biosynthesis
MAKIGIGVTTFRRPEMLQKCLDSIRKHTFMDGVTIYVADDSNERKGVAYRKNECLRALKDCDYIFLLDDDVEIIKDGWIEFFVDGYKSTSVNHFLYLNSTHNMYDKRVFASKYGVFTVGHYKDCGGVFMFMTKGCVEKVGAFNEIFCMWGFEHAEWSMRACNGNRNFNMLEGTENYIYSEDYSNPNHKSSITNEEKNLLFKKNFPKFAKGIKSIYLPL